MPCPYGLMIARVPAKKWETKADLLSRIEITRQIMEACPTFAVDVNKLADLAMVSTAHYIRLFAKTYGVTPGKYATRCRLKKASLRLKSGAKVSDVAILAGYSSLPSFCREFKRAFGCEPGKFVHFG